MLRYIDAERNPAIGDTLSAVTPAARVRFSVYYGPGVRAAAAVAAAMLLMVGLSLIIFEPEVDEPGEEWFLRGVVAFLLVTALLLLEILLFDIRLDTATGRLRKRGVWRCSVDLRTARFRLVETSWQVMVRLSPVNVKRFAITAPTLVVRSGLRRIRLPLARRFGHPVVDGRLVVQWLPAEQLGALADAIERSATAENTAKVVNYLRQLQNLSAGQSAPRPPTQPARQPRG
jgi:hypothetical protein